MDSKSDEHFLIIQSIFKANSQETDEKQMSTDEKLSKVTEDLKVLIANIT